jgi:HAD superfamily hydrolase (TIGR01490 family)
MNRPFAAFDIDGTVIRWQLYHAIADELVRQGLIDKTAFQAVRDLRLQWKKRVADFEDYEQALVKLVSQHITGLGVNDVQAACQRVLHEYKDQVYTHTRDLIKELRSKNYLLFAISGSQQEIVGPLADYYGFDDFGGTVYEIKDGHFTGQADALRANRKTECLKQLVDKHQASWQGSIAVGDSGSDIPMLSSVEQPIAFNPSHELFEHAKSQNWDIVIERKNVVYQLMAAEHTYQLKD